MTVSVQNGQVESQLRVSDNHYGLIDLNFICRLKLIRVNVSGIGLQISK